MSRDVSSGVVEPDQAARTDQVHSVQSMTFERMRDVAIRVVEALATRGGAGGGTRVRRSRRHDAGVDGCEPRARGR